VEKYGGARGATNDSMAACCRISKATLAQAHSCSRAPTHMHTHKYVILLFHDYSGHVNAPSSYFVHVLPFLFVLLAKVRCVGVQLINIISCL
jgi:hypothetical protein